MEIPIIPFEVSHEPQNLRVLELPPSLLEMIRSENPPTLKLKSAAVTSSGSQQPAPYAVLCTDTRSFQIRQVQTSNTVFVVQPTEKPLPSGEANPPAIRLCAIAQCPSLLELVPSSSSSIAFLRQNLPEYDGDQSDGSPPTRSTTRLEPWDKASKSGILEDAPFSAKEFDQAWQELCVFEHGSASWIPAPSVLVSTWDAVIQASSVRGLKLDERLSTSAILSTVEELHLPEPLVEAVLARVSARGQDGQDGYVKLDRGKCVSWVGAVLLQSFDGERQVPDFIKQWKNKLPEAWRGHAALEAIMGKSSQPTSTTIIFNEKGSAANSGASAPSKAPAAKAKPNWHERFKNAKR